MFKITYMIANQHRESVDYLYPENVTGKTLGDAEAELLRVLEENPLNDDQFIEIVSIDEIVCSYGTYTRDVLKRNIVERLK